MILFILCLQIIYIYIVINITIYIYKSVNVRAHTHTKSPLPPSYIVPHQTLSKSILFPYMLLGNSSLLTLPSNFIISSFLPSSQKPNPVFVFHICINTSFTCLFLISRQILLLHIKGFFSPQNSYFNLHFASPVMLHMPHVYILFSLLYSPSLAIMTANFMFIISQYFIFPSFIFIPYFFILISTSLLFFAMRQYH